MRLTIAHQRTDLPARLRHAAHAALAVVSRMPMQRVLSAGLLLAALAWSGILLPGTTAHAQTPVPSQHPAHPAPTQPGARQDIAILKSLAEGFLLAQAANLPGNARVSLKDPDPRLNLPACPAPEPWLPAGSKALGKTAVGIRCAQPAWQVLLPATVSVMTSYVASAAPLAQGQKLGVNDLMLREGDLASLPPGVLTDVAQAQGRTLQMPLAASMPLSRSQLKSQPVVQQGQPVRLVALGQGFMISGEGRALTSGSEGDLVQARTAAGQLVAGIAQADGSLSVRY